MKVKDKRLRKRMTRNQSLEGLLGEGVAEERLLIVDINSEKEPGRMGLNCRKLVVTSLRNPKQ